MEFSTKLKERFCKDCNIPIRIFEEPYFTDRMNLLDRYYKTLGKLKIFEDTVLNNPKFQNEQDYFEEYNAVKDHAIGYIKTRDCYNRFNNMDMNEYSVDPRFRKLPGKDIYHSSNDGRQFVSVDMKKANFSALRFYDEDMFGGAETWEDFIRMFTDVQHIIESKYIRQVVLGNCNCKRHITYEKYLMSCYLSAVVGKFFGDSRILEIVVFFSNDEVVFDVTDFDETDILMSTLKDIRSDIVPFKIESFTLHKIVNYPGFYKEIHGEDGSTSIEFKCVDNYALPFIIRQMDNEPVQDTDKVFMFEGRLAKFID